MYAVFWDRVAAQDWVDTLLLADTHIAVSWQACPMDKQLR
jgi:hypothetical protein